MFAGLHSSVALPLVGWMCLLAFVMLFERLRSRHLLRRMWRGIAELDDDKAEDVPHRLYPMFNAPQTALATVVIHQRAWSQGLLRGWKEEGERTVSTRSFVLRLDDGRRLAVQLIPSTFGSPASSSQPVQFSRQTTQKGGEGAACGTAIDCSSMASSSPLPVSSQKLALTVTANAPRTVLCVRIAVGPFG